MAYGAQGGNATISPGIGGSGAIIGGEFTLTAGETLDLFIGAWRILRCRPADEVEAHS